LPLLAAGDRKRAGETAPSLLEEMGNTIIPLGKDGERRGVILEFENVKMTNLLNW
jgi:hypothetical protein